MYSLVPFVLRRLVPALLLLAIFTPVVSPQSTSIWLEAECASVGSLWNKLTDLNASNSSYVVIQPGNNSTSRNGKGALTAGAFDERIKLTIPQESGSGGSGSWRVSDWMLSQGQDTQTLSEIVNENVWFRANFSQFSNAANKLPFDHHSIIGLVAPRAILIIENDILWLGSSEFMELC